MGKGLAAKSGRAHTRPAVPRAQALCWPNAAPGSIRAAAPAAERICRRLAESGALPPAALTTGPGATGDGTFGLTTRALAEAQAPTKRRPSAAFS